jgi:bacterioferritin
MWGWDRLRRMRRDGETAHSRGSDGAHAVHLRARREGGMRGHDEVIGVLNDVLTAELTAINQYFIHARMCESWGYERLWKKLREESIGEMRDADRLIERILYLESMPNLQKLGKVNVGETVPEQLRVDLEAEKAAIALLNKGIEQCRSVGDNGSRELLEEILEGEERHASWLEAQLTLIAQVGEANYLAQQIIGRGE